MTRPQRTDAATLASGDDGDARNGVRQVVVTARRVIDYVATA